MVVERDLGRAFADLQDRLQAVEGQLYRLVQSEGLIGQHGGQHNGGLGDEVAIAVWENGTIQDALHGLNLGAQFAIAPNTQFDRHDITIGSLVQTLLTGTAWRVGYTNGSGVFTELALGAAGTYLGSNGAASAPTFSTPASGWSPTITAKSAAYTAVKNDVVLCTGTFTVTLTAAATVATGGIIVVKNVSTGVITVDGNGAETIDGNATIELVQWDSIALITDGTSWYIW